MDRGTSWRQDCVQVAHSVNNRVPPQRGFLAGSAPGARVLDSESGGCGCEGRWVLASGCLRFRIPRPSLASCFTPLEGDPKAMHLCHTPQTFPRESRACSSPAICLCACVLVLRTRFPGGEKTFRRAGSWQPASAFPVPCRPASPANGKSMPGPVAGSPSGVE